MPLHRLHCRHQIVGSVGLKNPPTNPRFQAVAHHLLGVDSGKDQDYLVRIVFQNLPGRVQSIQFWQADVQNKKIWFQLHALLDRISSVVGLSTDLPAFVRSKQRAQTEAKYRMIVSHQNAKASHKNLPTLGLNL